MNNSCFFSHKIFLPELTGSTHGDVSLHGYGQGHVDRGAERDGGHGVQEVNIPCHKHYSLALITSHTPTPT